MARRAAARDRSRPTDHRDTVLVLQGGGALGAYQAGVYEALAAHGMAPTWVTGVSIGAINATLIAGNRLEDRVARLRTFWERVSSGLSIIAPASLDPLRLAFSQFATTASATFGVPGLFVPRVPPPVFLSRRRIGALSLYDTTPLRETLVELVDFGLINERAIRLAVGAVAVHSGNSVYFDNRDPSLAFGPEHVMASGALPPGFPPVRIGDVWYWDGGLASNSPLWYVLDDNPTLDALVLQVDLFSARGPLPRSLDEVLERAKDIQYSSKTRFNTTQAKEQAALREALLAVIAKLPARLKDDGGVKLLAERARGRRVALVHLINRRTAYSTSSKDYDFSRATIRALWEAGHTDMMRTIAHPDWREACTGRHGMRTYDLLL